MAVEKWGKSGGKGMDHFLALCHCNFTSRRKDVQPTIYDGFETLWNTSVFDKKGFMALQGSFLLHRGPSGGFASPWPTTVGGATLVRQRGGPVVALRGRTSYPRRAMDETLPGPFFGQKNQAQKRQFNPEAKKSTYPLLLGKIYPEQVWLVRAKFGGAKWLFPALRKVIHAYVIWPVKEIYRANLCVHVWAVKMWYGTQVPVASGYRFPLGKKLLEEQLKYHDRAPQINHNAHMRVCGCACIVQIHHLRILKGWNFWSRK